MPQSYEEYLIQELLEISVMKMIEMDRDPDPPMLKQILILNLLKRAGVPKSLLFGASRRDGDHLRSEAKYRKLNDGSARETGEQNDSLPTIDVAGLINHIAQGFPLIP